MESNINPHEQQINHLVTPSGKQNKVYWIIDHDDLYLAPGTLIQDVGDEIHVQCIVDNEYFSIDKPAQQVHPTCLLGVSNLLELGEFDEGSLLHTVRTRFVSNKIYTSIGSPILISINPYQNLKDVFTTHVARKYREHSLKMLNGQRCEDPGPHLFSVAEGSYQSMLIEKKNQSIIISGESGSGKTEATKIILCYLAKAKSNFQDEQNVDFIDMQRQANSKNEGIEKQVLDSNPLLEAFGNAKTFKNNNSSRFGKFIKVNFDQTGKIECAQISQYLLEKSRVAFQLTQERNFHIFYQIQSCLEFKSKYNLLKMQDYHYMNQSGLYIIPQVDDEDDMKRTLQCMKNVGFSTQEIDQVIDIVVGILNLGNVTFHEGNQQGVGPCAKIIEETKPFALQFGKLIGIDDIEAIESLLTMKVQNIMGDVININLQLSEANDARDTIAKMLFKNLFTWIVQKVNASISNNFDPKKAQKCKFIGILDIFGFEIFKENSFEQLCINYANEKLQHQFNQHMFFMEQEEYNKEKVEWNNINFSDNLKCIELIENPKSLSLFKFMDEECMIKGNDNNLLKKFHQNLQDNKYYGRSKKRNDSSFIVKHYAGNVEYNISSFIEKNKDSQNEQINLILKKSSSSLIQELVAIQEAPATAAASDAAGNQPASSGGSNMMRKFNQGQQQRGSANGGRGSVNNTLKGNTLSNQFRLQLNELISTLKESSPRYIRCIKPNSKFSPTDFDSYDVIKQLRCAGMLEAIRIRSQGYAVRIAMEEFLNRYTPILCKTKQELDQITMKDKCEAILAKSVPPSKYASQKDIYQIGITKVFMKENARILLEQAMAHAQRQQIIHIQKIWRSAKAKKIVSKMKEARQKQANCIYRYVLRKRFRSVVKDYMEMVQQTVVRLQRAYRRRLGHLAVMSTINERINDRVDLQNLVERRQKELDAVSLRQQQEAYEIEEQQIVDANESVFRESVIFVGGETKNEEQQDSWNDLQAANANLRSENEELKQTIEQKDEKIVELEIKLQETPGNEMSRTNVQSIIKNFDFDIASMYVDENNQTSKNLEYIKQIDSKEEEINELRQQIQVLEASMSHKDKYLASLKEENAIYQEKNAKWIKKLDDEIEGNSANVEELTIRIHDLEDKNFKLEFSLNQRATSNGQDLLQQMDVGNAKFDSANKQDLQILITQMQKELKKKQKEISEQSQNNFYLKETLGKDNQEQKQRAERMIQKLAEQKLTINEKREEIAKKEEQVKKYKVIQKILEEKLQNLQKDGHARPSESAAQAHEVQREIARYRSMNVVLQSENQHLKEMNEGYILKMHQVASQNDQLIDKLQEMKREKAIQRMYDKNDGSNQQQYLLKKTQENLDEIKHKYARVKDKCFKLNKESEYYNQLITVFLTIKKILEKQMKFTKMLQDCSGGSQGVGSGSKGGKNSVEDGQSVLTTPGSPEIRGTDNRSQLTANGIQQINTLNVSKRAHQTVGDNLLLPPRSTDRSGFSNKKNLFQKKGPSPMKIRENQQQQKQASENSGAIDSQKPEEIKSGIQLCKEKLAQLEQRLSSLMTQLKTNQMDLLMQPSNAGSIPQAQKNSQKENFLKTEEAKNEEDRGFQTERSNQIEF